MKLQVRQGMPGRDTRKGISELIPHHDGLEQFEACVTRQKDKHKRWKELHQIVDLYNLVEQRMGLIPREGRKHPRGGTFRQWVRDGAGSFYDSSGRPNAPRGSIESFDYYRQRQFFLDQSAICRAQESQSHQYPCGR